MVIKKGPQCSQRREAGGQHLAIKILVSAGSARNYFAGGTDADCDVTNPARRIGERRMPAKGVRRTSVRIFPNGENRQFKFYCRYYLLAETGIVATMACLERIRYRQRVFSRSRNTTD